MEQFPKKQRLLYAHPIRRMKARRMIRSIRVLMVGNPRLAYMTVTNSKIILYEAIANFNNSGYVMKIPIKEMRNPILYIVPYEIWKRYFKRYRISCECLVGVGKKTEYFIQNTDYER